MRVGCFKAAALAVAFVVGAASQGFAQNFPTRPIRVVVPTTPSAPPDLITRIIAAEVQKAEGWTVVVENKPGAIQTVAGLDVMRSPADGYSIWSMGMVSTVAPALIANIRFDVEKDFTHLTQATRSYNVLVVNPALPINSIPDLIAAVKASPEKFNFSSGGFGTPAHLIGELFKLRYELRSTHVPYVQFPQAIHDLVSGVNQYMFITTLPVIELVNSGKLRALAVTAPKRLEAIPSVQTMAEAGYPELAIGDWHGFAVRSQTPPQISEMLAAAFAKAISSPATVQALAKIGAEAVGNDSATFTELVKRDVASWSKVVKDAGIKAIAQ
jgi:tripartite-type tricarboxylate transporter receptor subunit TctC